MQRLVGRHGFGFHIDEQGDRGSLAINASAVLFRAFAQRIKVEHLERALGLYGFPVVGHQETSFDQVDIRLDAAEAARQRVVQRTRVLVVVMSVGAEEWSGFSRPSDCRRAEREDV